MSELREMITVEIVVKATIDPERFAEEYGDDDPSTVRDRVTGDVEYMIESATGTTNMGAFEYASHWLRTATRTLPPAVPEHGEHGDAASRGERPGYDGEMGKFFSVCVCGRKFYGDDEDDADSELYNHVFPEAEDCPHDCGTDSQPEPGDRCKLCGVPVTWIGPGDYDYEAVS